MIYVHVIGYIYIHIIILALEYCHELYGICITIIICQYWKSRDVR